MLLLSLGAGQMTMKWRKLGFVVVGLAIASITSAIALEYMISVPNDDRIIDAFGFLFDAPVTTHASPSMSPATWATLTETNLRRALMGFGSIAALSATVIGSRAISRGQRDYFFVSAVCLGILGLVMNLQFVEFVRY